MILAGLDLAWKPERNPTALAVGELQGGTLRVRQLDSELRGLEPVLRRIDSTPELTGIAIDASLIINNRSGQRPCETELSREYGSRRAGCHASNLSLYPDAASVRLSRELQSRGFEHLGDKRWQIEVYPHPALIELFGLPERLAYKKGRVDARRQGQQRLAQLIGALANASPRLVLAESLEAYLSPARISGLKGQALKSNEDALDALVCLYLAALYSLNRPARLFGELGSGYIWVPQGKAAVSV